MYVNACISSLGNYNYQFKNFLKQLQVNGSETQVELATALYVQKERHLKNCYKNQMACYYGAKTESVDFRHNSTKVTQGINSGVHNYE